MCHDDVMLMLRSTVTLEVLGRWHAPHWLKGTLLVKNIRIFIIYSTVPRNSIALLFCERKPFSSAEF